MRPSLRIRSFIVLIAFLVTSFGPLPSGNAQELILPKPGVRVALSSPVNPVTLKGIKVYPRNPFLFDFILDTPTSNGTNQDALKQEATRLIKYFLASLTIPEQDLWVNLSPYEKDRIIAPSFGLTEMGRDLLAQDYLLKQVTASLIYPEGELGKKFWKRIYEEAAKRYGRTDIPLDTFNKVWIVPEKAVVYENAKAGTAYVVESRMRVMLEVDYLSMSKNIVGAGPRPARSLRIGAGLEPARTDVNQLGSQIIREIVIPALTREVNEGENFAQLRQVYNSLILATWYKKKIKNSILTQVYANQNKVAGVGFKDLNVQTIYTQYLTAFKKGVYNYIKDEPDPTSGQVIPKKYFSGGMLLSDKAMNVALDIQTDSVMFSRREILKLAGFVVKVTLLRSVGFFIPKADHPVSTRVSDMKELKKVEKSLPTGLYSFGDEDANVRPVVVLHGAFVGPSSHKKYFENRTKSTYLFKYETLNNLDEVSLTFRDGLIERFGHTTDPIDLRAFSYSGHIVFNAFIQATKIQNSRTASAEDRIKAQKLLEIFSRAKLILASPVIAGSRHTDLRFAPGGEEAISNVVGFDSGYGPFFDWTNEVNPVGARIKEFVSYYAAFREAFAQVLIIAGDDDNHYPGKNHAPEYMPKDVRETFSQNYHDMIEVHAVNGVEPDGTLIKGLIPGGTHSDVMSGTDRAFNPINAILNGQPQTKRDDSALGGIDFNPDQMNLETRAQNGEIVFYTDPAMLQSLQKVQGFEPKIMQMEPMTDLMKFLGVPSEVKT